MLIEFALISMSNIDGVLTCSQEEVYLLSSSPAKVKQKNLVSVANPEMACSPFSQIGRNTMAAISSQFS